MNKDEMIDYYISLIPSDYFELGELTKDKVRKRLNKLNCTEIGWEIKSAEKINEMYLGWD